MRFKLILVCALVFALLATAANALNKNKPELVGPLPDSVTLRQVKPPKFKKEVEPEYPRLAREGGFGGYVEVRAFVDSTGQIIDVDCRTDRPQLGFEWAVEKAARESVFKPAKMKGRPVGAWINYKVIFDLEDGVRREAIDSYELE